MRKREGAVSQTKLYLTKPLPQLTRQIKSLSVDLRCLPYDMLAIQVMV